MRALFVLFLIIQSYIWPIIKELPSFAELEQYIHNETLVVFDLDNTLIRPKQMLGSDEWFWYYLNKKTDEYNDKQRALKEVLPLWQDIQASSSMQCLEPCTKHVVEALQKKGIPVMVLTTREYDFANVSVQQLCSLELDFSKTAPVKGFVKLHKIPIVQYEDGILFADNHHKGEALLHFLQQHSLQPKRVIFIDDKHTRVEEPNVLESIGIEYLGLRYTAADKYVREFDPKVTEEQFQSFIKQEKIGSKAA